MNVSDVFNSENKFFSMMNKVWDVIVLNFYFCLTVILGIGPAATALYYALVKNVRKSRSYATTAFFHSFRQNFRQGFILGIVELAAAALFYLSFNYAMAMEAGSTVGQIYFTLWFIFATLFVFTYIYIFPVLSRFTATTWGTFKMAFVMSLRHLPYTLLIVLCLAVLIVSCWFFPPTILFGFAAYVLVKSLFIEKVFRKYMTKPDENDTSTDAWYLE
ncbi:MAG: DUF624 domain-containing protein [Lachnospiraceae bacterium]|nr:DUF624 domain-containing protein [Lachnospiraceae bacterium]